MNLSRSLNLIIAGVGGQGNLFASQVIARAAIEEGFSIRIAETYGVTQRGGPVYSQVRIGHEVYGPLIPRGRCDLILGLEPIEALRRAADYLAPGGSIAINSHVFVPLETKLGRQPDLSFETILEELQKLQVGKILAIDARTMSERAGGAATMNVLMIGTLFGFEIFPLSYDSVVNAVRTITLPRFLEANLLSLAKGREYAISFKASKSSKV